MKRFLTLSFVFVVFGCSLSCGKKSSPQAILPSQQESKVSSANRESLNSLEGKPSGGQNNANFFVNTLVEITTDVMDAHAEQHKKLTSLYTNIRRLNSRELDDILHDIFGPLSAKATNLLPRVALRGGFDTDADLLKVSSEFVERYTEFAQAVAREVAVLHLAECRAQKRAFSPCLENYLNLYLDQIFRHRVEDTEKKDWLSWILHHRKQYHLDDRGSFVDLTHALLMDEKFLFLGSKADRHPDGLCNRMVERLAIFLWGTQPDARLRQLAAQEPCALYDRQELQHQVESMMQDNLFARFLEYFPFQWFALTSFKARDTEPKSLGLMSKQDVIRLKEDMIRETTETFRHNYISQAPLHDLIMARRSYVNKRLAEFYGLTGKFTHQHTLVELGPQSERLGVLSQGAVLATFPSVIRRGLFFASQITCTEIPPPPKDANMIMVDGETARSEREISQAHARDPNCAGCHDVIDPPGYALLNFGPFGRLRTKDSYGVQVDTTSVWEGEKVSGLADLLAKVVAKEYFPKCVSEKIMTYGLGRRVGYASSRIDKQAIDQLVTGSDAQTVSVHDLVIKFLMLGLPDSFSK
ncbi:MAG: DUF1592 domain-containing protein [Zetaproteobacteria bacterium]|nr:DUF1592 domain-containing protein [Zetaproteobacteria bacterium]